MVDLGPIDPEDPRAVALRHKRDRQRNYLYRQTQRSAAGMLFGRKKRTRTYVVRVAADGAGRPVARTERYDPERGSGNPKRVDIPRLPGTIAGPMAVFAVAVFIILMLVLPFPLNSMAGLYWSFSLMWRMAYAVERKRFAEHLRTYVEPPPLLSDAELEARVFKLLNPDEDRTFDEPAPIPMARGLRDPAWKRWEDKLAELPDQEYRVGRVTYDIKKRGGFNDSDRSLHKLISRIRAQSVGLTDYRVIARTWGQVDPTSVHTTSREDHESLRPLFEALGREVLGDERVAELEDSRRATAHGEPFLSRRFAARTDCADGHVGKHPILSTFTDSLGRQRVRRGCSWCPSVWSERV